MPTNPLLRSVSWRIIPLLILLFAFALQLSYLAELRFIFPDSLDAEPFCGVDAITHHQRALGLMSGQYPADKPWLFIPFYPAYLAITYGVFGVSFSFPVVLQMILNLLTCAALFAIGHRLFSPTVGALSSLAMALYAPYIYYLPCFDQSLLTIPFLALTVFFLLRFYRHRYLIWLLLAAVGVTLGALSRPTVLILIPAVVLWLFLYRISLKKFLGEAVCFTGVVLLLISPITWHNYRTTGLFIPLSKNGGVNLFTGNNPDASGLDSLAHAQSQPAVLRHIELQGRRKSGETSYSAEVIKFIREQPGDWLKLTVTKTWLWFGETDKPLISPFFPLAIEESSILRRLPFEWRAMVFVGLLGLILVRSRNRQTDVLIWLIYGSFSLATIIFFIQLRFRLPFVPIVLIYAMALTIQGRQWIRHAPLRFWIVLSILLVVYPFLPTLWVFILIYAGLGLWSAFKPNGAVIHRWALIAVWSYLVVGSFFIHAQAAATNVSQTIAHYLGPRLVGNGVLGQTFEMNCNNLNYLAIKLGVFDDNHNQPVTLALATNLAAKEIQFLEQIDGSKVRDHQWIEFTFDSLPDSRGRTYFFFITSPTSTQENSLTARGYSDAPIDQYKTGEAYGGVIGSLQKLEADFAFMAACDQSPWEKLLTGVTNMAERRVWESGQSSFYWGIFWLHLILLIVAVGGLAMSLLRRTQT